METLPSPDLHPLSLHEGTALLSSQSQILVAHFESAFMESPTVDIRWFFHCYTDVQRMWLLLRK